MGITLTEAYVVTFVFVLYFSCIFGWQFFCFLCRKIGDEWTDPIEVVRGFFCIAAMVAFFGVVFFVYAWCFYCFFVVGADLYDKLMGGGNV